MINIKYKRKTKNRIIKLIHKYKVISFDIFDTLLIRPFARPKDLFLYIEKKYNEKGYCNNRIHAEQLARQKSQCEEITLDEIYSYVDKNFIYLKNIEIKSELEFLRPNPLMKEIFDYCKSIQKRIILISDMYLDEKIINQCLNKNGYYEYELFLSSSIKLSKSSGNLFKFICSKFQSQTILHIGDNYFSDYIKPISLGINSIFVPSPIALNLNSNLGFNKFYNKYENDLTASILLGVSSIFQFSEENKYFYNFGKAIGGPVLTAFAKRIFDEAKENKYDLVLFSSRDGYILEYLFSLMSNNKIKSRYVYANRCLWNMINFDLIEKSGNIEDYQLQGIVDKIINLCINNSNFNNINVPSLKSSLKLKIDFIKNNKILLLQTQNTIRTKYNQYIKDVCANFKNICIVDSTTAHFSAQKLIQSILKTYISGFYFFLGFENINNRESITSASAFHNIREKNIKFTNDFFIEFLCSSPEPPIIGYESKPIYLKINNYEKQRIKLYKEYINGVMDYYKYHNDLFNNETVFTNSNAIVEFLNCLSDSPTFFDYNNLKKIILADDMTGKFYKHLFNEWREKKLILKMKIFIKYLIKEINFKSLIKNNNKVFRKELQGKYMIYYFRKYKVFKKRV